MGHSQSSKLKSPRRRKLSYFDENRSRFLPISSRCLLIRFLFGLSQSVKTSRWSLNFPSKMMTSCNARWQITLCMRNTNNYIWFLWGCLIDRVLYLFAFTSKKENKLYTFRFAHASGYPFCSENNLQNQRNLFFLKILDCQLLLKNHHVTSIEGAMILVQLLMVLEVLLIVNLLNKS